MAAKQCQLIVPGHEKKAGICLFQFVGGFKCFALVW